MERHSCRCKSAVEYVVKCCETKRQINRQKLIYEMDHNCVWKKRLTNIYFMIDSKHPVKYVDYCKHQKCTVVRVIYGESVDRNNNFCPYHK